MKDNKQEWEKEFDQIFWKGKDETAYWKYDKQYKEYKSFISQKLKEQRERIIEDIENFSKEFKRGQQGNYNGRDYIQTEEDGRVLLKRNEKDLTIPDYAKELCCEIINKLKQ
jgi:hypothetical protein